jgi:hypothetical protein
VEGDFQRRLAGLAAEAGVRAPLLVESDLVAAPAVTGLFSPRLVLPRGLLGRFDPGQERWLFLHELVHLRRRDLWLLMLFAVARTLHWFNPLVWLAERALRADCEAACDAGVLHLVQDAPGQYGNALLHFTQLLSGRRPAAVTVAAISTSAMQTERRLRMIVAYRPMTRGIAWFALGLAIFFGILALPNEAPAQQAAPDLSLMERVFHVPPDFLQRIPDGSTPKITPPNGAGVLDVRAPLVKLGLDFPAGSFARLDADKHELDIRNTRGQLTHFFDYLKLNFPELYEGTSEQSTARKISSIVIDRVNLNRVDIVDVLQFLTRRSKDIDPEKKGVVFVLDNLTTTSTTNPVHREVSVVLDNVPLGDLISYIMQQTNLTYAIEKDGAVHFHPPGTADTSAPEAPRAVLLRKLNSVRIDTFQVDHADLGSVIQALVVKSKEADPEKVGINFVLNLDTKKTSYLPAVTLNLKNASLGFILDAVCRQASLEYVVDDYAVYLRPPASPADMYTVRTYRAPTGFFKGEFVPEAALPGNSGVLAFDVRDQLTKAGIHFPDGSTAVYIKSSGKIIVRSTPEVLDAVAGLVEKASAAPAPTP